MIGQGVTYHYFTDTVGGVLLGTAIACVAALTLGRAPHRT
jgi:membrane-associated phospholipid phosphatase